ncbi:hypothetical protein LTR27_002210 [Elasticomyces elasticus]|nr:hypothetical protein LTR27_002210 [Elasticomyces elasticus]
MSGNRIQTAVSERVATLVQGEPLPNLSQLVRRKPVGVVQNMPMFAAVETRIDTAQSGAGSLPLGDESPNDKDANTAGEISVKGNKVTKSKKVQIEAMLWSGKQFIEENDIEGSEEVFIGVKMHN